MKQYNFSIFWNDFEISFLSQSTQRASEAKTVVIGCHCTDTRCDFYTPLLHDVIALGPVHTYPFLFENGDYSLQIAFPSTRIRQIRSPKTELFKNAYQSEIFENAVFLHWCGRVRTKLFKNTYVMVSCPARDLKWGTDVSLLYRFCLGFFHT